jgi:hypothetical protein
MQRALRLIPLLTLLGCATGGPSPEELRREAQYRQWEAEENKLIDKDAAQARQDIAEVDKWFADWGCNDQVRVAALIDACTKLRLVRHNYQMTLLNCDSRRRDIQFRQSHREHERQAREYQEAIDQRVRIQEAFKPRYQPTCRTEKWGNDYRTTCN